MPSRPDRGAAGRPTACSRSAAASRDRHREGRLGRDRPAARLRADDVLRRRVDADASACAHPTGGCVGGGGGAKPRRDRLRRRAHARAAAGRDGRHGAERARPLRRGALRARPRTTQATSARSQGARADRARRCRASSRTPGDVEARTRLLRGAAHGGRGARRSRASGSRTRWRRRSAARYGLPHGAMNALSLPPALRFNARLAPEAVARFGEAIGGDDPAAQGRGARAPRRVRAAARLRRPRGRTCPQWPRRPPARAGNQREPAAGDAGRDRGAPPYRS